MDYSTKKSLSLSLITSIESISAPSSFVTIASLASNPNFSPVQEDIYHKSSTFFLKQYTQ